MTSSRASLVSLALLGLWACGKKVDSGTPAAASASAAPKPFKPAAPVASGLPGTPELVSKAVNPENEPAYSGPTGSVRGIVTAVGDPPAVATAHLAQIKGKCPEAREVYGHVFREGMLRSLADVLVAVTGYSGYVPATEPKQTVSARGCAFSTRTIALTFGQTLDIVSKDAEGYVPNLLGARMQAQLLALPGGAPSTVYPPQPGHYVLTDDIKVFMLADVFVLKYSTHDVTNLDGRFEIKGIPVGKARISALLPSTQVVVEKDIEIKAGETLELPLELRFDAKAQAAAAAAAASATAAPAASASPKP
ncbi:MAG TPA: hypothetical protein VHP33_39685 [Polyangiaceae bacterium]|nr:hypothetical protein [Polyangiaceae bacterium]